MTLVELLVAVAITAVVFAASGSMLFYTSRSFVALINYTELDRKSRNAVDKMSQEIRQVDDAISCSVTNLSSGQTITNSITFSGTESDGVTTYTLSYTYNPGSKKLTRTKTELGTTTTSDLLTGCDYFNFEMCQRNTQQASYNVFATADPATCKLVRLYWICSRTIFGKTANTESIESARVVIRRK